MDVNCCLNVAHIPQRPRDVALGIRGEKKQVVWTTYGMTTSNQRLCTGTKQPVIGTGPSASPRKLQTFSNPTGSGKHGAGTGPESRNKTYSTRKWPNLKYCFLNKQLTFYHFINMKSLEIHVTKKLLNEKGKLGEEKAWAVQITTE